MPAGEQSIKQRLSFMFAKAWRRPSRRSKSNLSLIPFCIKMKQPVLQQSGQKALFYLLNSINFDRSNFFDRARETVGLLLGFISPLTSPVKEIP
ncbi:hypothetical protein A3860_12090 [Niastella vici]|uniref:Uncharacterized protein n=1 Tax=Niastella vici TaxID=1703345 RepID=A0A1V9FG86_9BACT|nr:hypothetical protein A3860_12090 [Niastella vici]